MKIHSSLLLLGLQAIALHASTTNTKANTVVPVSDIEKEVIENDKAVQGLGDLLIKKGLLSPWLEQMRDAQKALNDLDAKNKLGIREKALKMVEDRFVQCKERKSTRNTASNDPLFAEINTLQAQQEPLIQQIIAKKSADISELIALNDKINAKSDQYMQKRSDEQQKSSSANKNKLQGLEDKTNSSPEFNALLNKLQALSSILMSAARDKDYKLNQPIADLLSSNEAKEYVTILSKPMGFENCTRDLFIFRMKVNDEYGGLIDSLAGAISREIVEKNNSK